MKPISLLILSALPSAAAVSFTLPGVSEDAAWSGLNSANYPGSEGWNGFGQNEDPFPRPLTPDGGSTLGAEFEKLSGGGYFASASIYNFGVPGTLRVFDESPLGALGTVVFQADLGSALAGPPTLNFNGGSQALWPDFASTSPGDFVGGFGSAPEPTTNHAWQWDLSGVSGSIDDYEVRFTTAPHGTIYQLNLAAGDEFAQVVPEPTTSVLGALGVTLLLIRRRRG